MAVTSAVNLLQFLPGVDQFLRGDLPSLGMFDTVAGTYNEERSVGGTWYRTTNATYDRGLDAWLLVNPANPAYAWALLSNGTQAFYSAAAGTSPFTWTLVYSIDNMGNFSFNFGIIKLGTLGSIPVDGSAPGQVTYSTAYTTNTMQTLVTPINDYAANPWELSWSVPPASKTKNGFQIYLAGGPSGQVASADWLAVGV